MLAIANLTVPCDSTHIVESKSLKLYLNGFANTQFADAQSVRDRIRTDLSEAIWRGDAVRAQVGCSLIAPELFDQQMVQELSGLSLDRLDVECDRYTPAPELLTAAFDETPITEVLTSNLLKTNCPVTGQPDWGSVQIGYSGPAIEQGGLLKYLVSFRDHEDFHEHCVERIFPRHPAALPAVQADGARALHAPRRHRHQSISHQPAADAAAQRAHGTAVNPAAVTTR